MLPSRKHKSIESHKGGKYGKIASRDSSISFQHDRPDRNILVSPES
jgi:hypothetical protein